MLQIRNNTGIVISRNAMSIQKYKMQDMQAHHARAKIVQFHVKFQNLFKKKAITVVMCSTETCSKDGVPPTNVCDLKGCGNTWCGNHYYDGLEDCQDEECGTKFCKMHDKLMWCDFQCKRFCEFSLQTCRVCKKHFCDDHAGRRCDELCEVCVENTSNLSYQSLVDMVEEQKRIIVMLNQKLHEMKRKKQVRQPNDAARV